MALIPCPACQRHVYTTETNCPFCHHELGALEKTLPKRAPVGRMSRAALVVLGMSSVACGGDSEHSGDDTASNSGPTTGTPNTTGTNGGPNTTGTNSGPNTTNTGTDTNSTTTTTDTAASSWAVQAVQSAYGSPSIGFTTGEPPSGSGGTTSTDGGSMGGGAGEAGDVGGAGGNSGLPSTGGNGQPVYGAPPTPW